MIITAFDPGKLTSYARYDTQNPYALSIGEIELVGSGRMLRPCPMHVGEVLEGSDVALIEEVGPRPKEGVSSVYTFGIANGCVMGAAGVLEIPIEFVPANQWKTSARIGGLVGVEAKRAALAYARQLWPEHLEEFRKEASHGKADAALMARWFFMKGPGSDIQLPLDSFLRIDPADRKKPAANRKISVKPAPKKKAA
jgi:crossover junction endodeoxyribonuclease RuvC